MAFRRSRRAANSPVSSVAVMVSSQTFSPSSHEVGPPRSPGRFSILSGCRPGSAPRGISRGALSQRCLARSPSALSFPGGHPHSRRRPGTSAGDPPRPAGAPNRDAYMSGGPRRAHARPAPQQAIPASSCRHCDARQRNQPPGKPHDRAGHGNSHRRRASEQGQDCRDLPPRHRMTLE